MPGHGITPRRDTEAVITAPTRNRMVRGSEHAGSNPALSAMKMRATDNLSQRSSRMVNCLVTRKLPVWDEVSGWSDPQVTRSIAWALADIARSQYGGKLDEFISAFGRSI